MEIRTDFLIIGSGIAGLSFALKVSEWGDVVIVTKKEDSESNTNYAQGGIASVFAKDDSFELHIEDTLRTGGGLCDPEVVRKVVEAGPGCIEELIRVGVQFTRKRGKKREFDLGLEGGHSKNRVVHAADLTGREVENSLLCAVKAKKNVKILEDHIAIDLITQHHLKDYQRKADEKIRCWGAYVLDKEKNQVLACLSKITLLATGGAGRVYLHTTNPSIATGDGLAMAYRAGAKVANLEFIQFHPTALYHDQANSFLISEAVRGEGGILRLQSGESFMEKYHPRKELAPRDVVARAIDHELKKRGESCVYLDIAHLDQKFIKLRFPNIYGKCLSLGLDITKDPIPVVPAAHYICGGVVTDLEGRSGIENLYACGEVAYTGMHGANRLASNSLLEAVAFAHFSAKSAKNTLSSMKDFSFPSIPSWSLEGVFDQQEWVIISHNRDWIQKFMWDYVGIVRSNRRLKQAKRRISIFLDEITEFYKVNPVTYDVIELRNIATTSELIIECALQRKESRGLHYNLDYPQKNDKIWLKDTRLKSEKE
ncbi:MAG: L-aspartate oxidase [candidate division Zixibacteria bacterium SM23_73_3]|nr:MAG: L-aspartate oxidase [candidate division Zixibacteria bacterium SM23_73_3]